MRNLRIINKYIVHDYLMTFFLTLAVFTFVMCLGVVVRAIDLMSKGVSGIFILKIFAYNIPFILSFTIPMSVLTAVLLLFGRLSVDGEVTAMKACGLSIWQIVAPVVLLSIVLSVVCVFISSSVAPNSKYAQRNVLMKLGMEEPVNLLEEGRFVRDFPGLMVYVGKKDRRQVTDVVVYEMGDKGVKRNVRAKSGVMKADNENKRILIDLYDVRIDQLEDGKNGEPASTRYIQAEHYPVKLDFSRMIKKERTHKKNSDMTYIELIRAIRDVRGAYPDLQVEDLLKQRMSMVVESNKRLALSLSCFAFTLLGIPLGIKSHRKESSIGVGISLFLVFIFYFFIILANSLVGHPEYRPDMIVWIPVVFAEIFGFYLLYRAK